MAFLYAARNFAAGGKAFLSTPLGPCVSSDPEADYPASNAIDQRLSPPTRWINLTTTYSLDASVSVVQCGDMEQTGFPGWTTQTDSPGDVVVRPPYKGLRAIGMYNGQATQSVLVTAGASWRMSGAIRHQGAIYVRDAERGGEYYLDDTGTWVTGATPTIQGVQGTWTQATRTFSTVGFRDGWNRADGLLRIDLTGGTVEDGEGAGQPFAYDEVLVYPGVDVFAFVGHNFPPVATFSILRDSTNYWHGMSFTQEASSSTALKFPVGWYVHSSTLYQPFWRVQVDYPENGVAPRKAVLGELFIGKTVPLPNPSYDPKIEWTDEQVRVRSSGHLWAYRVVGHPRRKVTLSFPCSTDAQWQTLRDALGLTSGMGSTPGLLIPTEMELDQALYVNIADVVTVMRGPRSHRVVEVTFEELPFPVME